MNGIFGLFWLLPLAAVVSLLFGWLLHKFKHPKLMDWAETLVVYVIGGLSSFWLFERIAAF